jgi:hypothetical protein
MGSHTSPLARDEYLPWICAAVLTIFQAVGFFPLRYAAGEFDLFQSQPTLANDIRLYLLVRGLPALLWGLYLGEALLAAKHQWNRDDLRGVRSSLLARAGCGALVNALAPIQMVGYQLLLNWQYRLWTDWKTIDSILLWGFGVNMVFQVFLLGFVVGLFLPKSSRRRVQVTETIRI